MRQFFAGLGLILLLLACSAGPGTSAQDPPPAPDPMAEAKAKLKDLAKGYDDAKKGHMRTQMERSVAEIAALNFTDAAEFLLDLLAEDQADRKKSKAGLPGDLRRKVILALAKFTEEACVKLVGDAARKLDSSPKSGDPALALDQFDFFLALANMTASPAADDTLRAATCDPKNPYVKVAALEAVRQAVARRLVDDVVKVLNERNVEWAKTWTIVPINAFACLEKLIEPGDAPNVIKAVEATLGWVKWESENKIADDRIRFFGGRMLRVLTGETADMRSVPYWDWWLGQMKTVGKAVDTNKTPPKHEKTYASTPIFDTQPVGKRYVFVIDVSSSMELPLKITIDDIEKRRKERQGPVTSGPKGEKEKQEQEEEEANDKNNPLRSLPWQDIRTKIELAREELARSIKSLAVDESGKNDKKNPKGDRSTEREPKDNKAPEEREFAIIVYSKSVKLETSGWIKATPANCEKWAVEAKALKTESLTNIHGGLMKALKVSGKGSDTKIPSVDPDCVMTGADTILFLTDGWASWDDFSTTQRTKDPRGGKGVIGDGPFMLAEAIWPEIIRQNIFRKVVISTVGIGYHDKELLKKLSSETGGTYVDWGFKED